MSARADRRCVSGHVEEAKLDRHAKAYLVGLSGLLEEAGPGRVAPPDVAAFLDLDILEARQDLHHLIEAGLVRFSELDEADQGISDLDAYEPHRLTAAGKLLADQFRT